MNATYNGRSFLITLLNEGLKLLQSWRIIPHANHLLPALLVNCPSMFILIGKSYPRNPHPPPHGSPNGYSYSTNPGFPMGNSGVRRSTFHHTLYPADLAVITALMVPDGSFFFTRCSIPLVFSRSLHALSIGGFHWCQEALSSKADVVAIQEMHFYKDSMPVFTHKNFPHLLLASSHAMKRGVMIAIKDSVSFSLLEAIVDPEGRYILLLCTINNCLYTVNNAYAPNSHQMKCLHKLCTKISKVRRGSLIVCGDFNMVADPIMNVIK